MAAGGGGGLGFPPRSGPAPPSTPQPAPTHCQWRKRSDAARSQGPSPRRAEAEQAAASSGPRAGEAAGAVGAAPWTPWGRRHSRCARGFPGAAPPAGEPRGQRVRCGRPSRVPGGRRARAGGHAPPRCAPCPGVQPAAPRMAAQLAVVVPRAGLLAEGAGLAAGVLPPQPVATVAGAGLREDSGRSEPWALVPYASRRFTFWGLAVPDPSVLRARIGAKVRGGGLGERAGLVGRTGRGSGRGPRGAGAPTEARRGGPGGGVTQPERQRGPKQG